MASWLEDMLAEYARGTRGLNVGAMPAGTNDRRAVLSTDRGVDDPEPPGENAPVRPGPAGSSGESPLRLLLGRGVSRRPIGRGTAPVDTPYDRLVVQRGGKLMEAHDYGGGNVKMFARKNPALLEAAAGLARQPGADMQGYRSVAQRVQGMAPEDQERIRYLLGR